MSNISVEIWNQGKLWNSGWFDENGNSLEDTESADEMMQDAWEALCDTGVAGESYTIIVRKVGS